MTRRYDQARELRAYAKRVREIRFRGTERYLADLDELAGDMTSRADAIVREAEPAAATVFRTGPGRSATGTPFKAEKRGRRAA